MISSPLSQRSDRPPSTFITEMRNAKRYSNSARSSYSTKQKNATSMFPSITTNKASILPAEDIDQGKLDHTYELLVEEIRNLKSQISPIRKYFLQLKDRLLFQNRCAANSNIIISEQVPKLSEAIGDGTFSMVIDEFQGDSDSNIQQMTELRSKFSSFSIIKMSIDVDSAREEIIQMRKNCNEMKNENDEINTKLSKIKRSRELAKIDEQRKKMQKMILDISRSEALNVKLQKTVETLEKEVPEIAPENQEEFNEIQSLLQILSEKRQIYFKKCDELIKTRETQMKELQQIDKERKKNNKTSFQVNEPSEKPPNRGRKAFSQPVEIKDGNIGDEVGNEMNNANTQNELQEIPIDESSNSGDDDVHISDDNGIQE